MSVLIGILTGIHVLVALALIGLVLMQKSQDQGVGAAFGGGVTETVFGAGTTTALVRMTIWCACIMLGTTLLLAILHSKRGASGRESLMQKAAQSAPAMPGPATSQSPLLPVETTASTPATPVPATPAPAPEKPAQANP